MVVKSMVPHEHNRPAAKPLVMLLAAGVLLIGAAIACTPPGTEPAGDTIAPTVSISSTTTDPTGTNPIDVRITFSEDVTGFSVSDLTIVNAAAGNFTVVDARTYTVDLTPDEPELAVTIDIVEGVCTDAAGNPNLALADAFHRTYTLRPTVLISTSVDESFTNISPIPITITFSKAVEGFVEAEVALANCTMGGFDTLDDTVWTATLTPAGQGDLSASIAEEVCYQAGVPLNTNLASNSLSLTYDTVAPSVEVSSTEPDPTNSSIQITITFSEPIDPATFGLGDITVSSGSAENLQNTGNTRFTADVSPGEQGLITIGVGSGVCTDRAGNLNTAAPFSVTRGYDNVRPGVTIASTTPDPTDDSPIPISVTFTEVVIGFTSGDLSMVGGSVTNFRNSNSILFEADVVPDGQGLIRVDLTAGACQDAAGNTNVAASTLTRVYDTGSAPGDLDTDFLASGAGTAGYINALAVQADGKIVIGGYFTSYNGIAQGRIARLNDDGSLDESFTTGDGAFGVVNAVAFQGDGKVLIGGAFTAYNGTIRQYMARLKTDGTLDSGFGNVTGADDTVYAIVVQGDGKVLIGGGFTKVITTNRGRVARMNTNDTVDTGFAAGVGADGDVMAMALQSDGKVLIGGDFTTFDGTSRVRIARLNADGSLDADFDPGTGANDRVASIAVQSDGKIVIGGYFTSFNGASYAHVARLNADGSLDATFGPVDTQTVGSVYTVALQSNGKVIIGGYFQKVYGSQRLHVARLNADGSLDTSFLAGGNGAGDTSLGLVNCIGIQSDNMILIGGDFSIYQTVPRGSIARVWY